MIPQETVQLILDTARVEDVVGDFVTLKRRGASFVACCPFHNEKTPSFYVTPSKGIYKCFGCGKAGSAVGFVMEYEHCSYPDALRYLAKRYNIEIVEEEENAEEIESRQRKESLLLVSDFAMKYYNSQLRSGEGRSIGYAYFRSRGISDESIERFGLGWAPSGRTSFLDAAVAAGFETEYIIAAGLAVQQEGGALVDKFRERVMFPIHSVSGRVVAFSGRTLKSDNPAKYVNSAETEIYVKSRNLLGIYHAKSEISRRQNCILVEGNVDMVTLHQLGIQNVVASCGTSLTVEQIRLIKKFADDVTIMYDGDHAGIKAALRGINLVLAEDLNVKVVLLPDGEDPDSFGRKHTREEVLEYISGHERDFIEFKCDLLLEEAQGDPLKKANLINDVTDSISVIPDAVKRSVYVESCAGRFGVESDILFDRIRRVREKRAVEEQIRLQREHSREEFERAYEAEPVQGEPADREPAVENPTVAVAEKDLLQFLLNHGDSDLIFETDSEFYSPQPVTVAEFIRGAVGDEVLENSVYRSIYESYMAGLDSGADRMQILQRLYNSEDRSVAAAAVDLTASRYLLTVKSFEASMTTESSWLAINVPKAIYFYAERKIQCQLEDARRRLSSAASEEDEEKIMGEIIRLRGSQQKIKSRLGRDK